MKTTFATMCRKPVATIAFIFFLFIGSFACSSCRGSASEQSASASRYTSVFPALEQFIAREMEDKELPAVSIALVDDQQVIWAKGFGFANPKDKSPATAE